MTKLLAFISSLAAASAFAAGVWPDRQDRPPREDYNSGGYLYKTYCASCHGSGGRGDGPIADLEPQRPRDLTALSRQNGGVFPRADVRAALDAKKPVPAHGAPAMPNWREIIRRAERGDERTVDAAIDALIAHIESLQR
jgi:mono/diheme cytochrome c family protein